MTITAEVIADSTHRALDGKNYRLTTIAATYPRFIHAELMTHRAFSRNASSSRAIPVERMIDMIEKDWAKPVAWGKNQKGMQAREELTGAVRLEAEQVWNWAKGDAVDRAKHLARLEAHKQIVNRILEPFAHITVLISSTNWANFFALRDHEDADPTIQVLAQEMYRARDNSNPETLKPGQWHLPYIKEEDWRETNKLFLDYDASVDLLKKVSAARCARVSYLTHDKRRPTFDDDLALYERLALHKPVHASPLEHQATPDEQRRMKIVEDDGYVHFSGPMWLWPNKHGNFVGWKQFRHDHDAESVKDNRLA